MKEYFIDCVYYTNHIKCDSREEVESELSKIPLEAGSEVLHSGSLTNLCGYFDSPVEYIGFDTVRRLIIFYLGKETTLFESKHFYQTFFYINDKRLAIATLERCMSDLNFKNGKWK